MSNHKSEFERNDNNTQNERESEQNTDNTDNDTDNVSTDSGASAGESMQPLKGIDSLFTLEHQGMIAAKYRAKYSDLEQVSHKSVWPEYKGNHFMMYVLAETLCEARKAVFSANRAILINQLVGAMVNYTPVDATDKNGNPLAVTELQVLFNKATDQQLNALTDQLPDESNRTDVLKAYAKTLKQSARTGRDIDAARLKFYHAADVLGVVAGTIW
jgi:hypothetical protein